MKSAFTNTLWIPTVSRIIAVLAVILGCVGLSSRAAAQSVGGFVSPGELAAPHADLSGLTGCFSCHSVGAGVSADKCLACHDTVRDQVQNRQGFHADKGRSCETCHPDHRGSAFQLIRLVESTFDHDQTGFPLDGAHEVTRCADCHTEPGEWGGLSRDCASCHDDPHGSRQGRPKLTECAACHDVVEWAALPLPPAVFDHDDPNQADYALHGQHEGVACEDCHADWQFVPTDADACSDCHQDPHRRQFGAKTCDTCHTVDRAAFALRDYDHSKTAFPLDLPHRSVSCEACHGDGRAARYVGLPHDRCETCHEDVHDGQFAPRDCDACHLPSLPSFALAGFDHDTTRFPLRNGHVDVSCDGCHEGDTFAGVAFDDCDACHVDAHEARFEPRPCTECHEDGVIAVASFDHDLARFHLDGGHADVACADCHGEGDARVLAPLPHAACTDCHTEDDPHRAEATATCTTCHVVDDWAVVTFAHQEHTGFALLGEHRDLDCASCHEDASFEAPGSECAACHEDDRPRNHFDGDCQGCHVADGWRPATLGDSDHAITGFALHGRHADVACSTCHDGPRPVPQCSSCHADDDPHRNQLGNGCDTCHGELDWFTVRYSHHLTGWPLRGAHRLAACQDCHAAGWVGTPTECRRCHEHEAPASAPHDDPAARACDVCHRPYAWEPARWPHGGTP
jgi:hypothetical protein